MPRRVRIRCGSRLHFGLLSLRSGSAASVASPGNSEPPAPRLFGGVGMMVDAPRLELTAELCGPGRSTDEFIAPADVTGRLQEFVSAYRQTNGVEAGSVAALPPVRLCLDRALPSHQGLGSGTQLALAVARAMNELRGVAPTPSARQLALQTGRGQRSAIGVHGFAHGGLLVDAGQRGEATDRTIGTLVSRVRLPRAWRVLLITPRDHAGLSGSSERQAFARLEATPLALTAELCRLLLTEILPAARERDCAQFRAALVLYGQLVGDYFSPVQGGTFAHPFGQHLHELVASAGLAGLVQSSWGPTLCAFCATRHEAAQLADLIARDEHGALCRRQIVRPLSQGAQVTVTDE